MSSARQQLGDAHRVVVKLGSHVVTHDGVELALGRVMELVEYRRAQTVTGTGDVASVVPDGFGDNDGLSARVAVSLDADLLVLLTNVGGLYTANPRNDPSAVRLAELAAIDEATLARASG